MAEIPLQMAPLTGVELTEGPAAAGDTAQVGNNKFLIVENNSASSVTVTLAIPGNDYTGAARPDVVVAIPAGKTRFFQLLNDYADPALGGQAAISYSALPSVVRSVVAIP